MPPPRPLYAGRCGPDSTAQLQPIPYACGAQRTLLPIAVGAMNINELMNINDVRESATTSPRPCKLTFDLLTSKVVSESRVTRATCMPILGFLGLSVLVLFPMYATDRRQTDVDTCIVPRTRTRFGDRSYSAAGPRIWNSLPPDLRRPDIELGEFRRLLKTFLFV